MTTEDLDSADWWADCAEALKKQAAAGDVKSAKLLLQYLNGPERRGPDLTGWLRTAMADPTQGNRLVTVGVHLAFTVPEAMSEGQAEDLADWVEHARESAEAAIVGFGADWRKHLEAYLWPYDPGPPQ